MKQHYIPRCYLRKFSDNGKSIYTYDKKESRSYLAPLMSVCCEDDLYTISESYTHDNNTDLGNNVINTLSLEHDYFANIQEPSFSQTLSDLDKIKEGWINGSVKYKLEFDEKKEIALHLITLYFRLPHVMNSIINNYLRFERADLDMLQHILAVQTGNDNIKDLKINIQCEKPVLHAQLSYLNDELLTHCAEELASNYFVFWTNHDNSFYTSDFPITVKPHIKDTIPACEGLVQYGGEVMVSLSPSLALSIYDRNFFKGKEYFDACFIEADDKEIRRHNWMNYLYSKRHVFSLNGNFDILDFFYKMNGKHEFFTPNLNAEIKSGLGNY